MELRSGGFENRLLLPGYPDHLVPTGTDPDDGDRDADEVGDEVEIVTGGLRQLVEAAGTGDVLVPARELLVLGLHPVKDRLVVGELVEGGALGMAIADADADRPDPGEDVELGDDQPGHPVQPRGVAERDEIEP